MTGTGPARWWVRWAGAGQLVALTALAGAGAGSHPAVLTGQRGNCGWPPQPSLCVPADADLVGRWAGLLAGAALAAVAAFAVGWRRRLAAALAVAVFTAGTAAFSAEQARWNHDRLLACVHEVRGVCAYPPWEVHYLQVGAVVGLALGVLGVTVERASRVAARRAPTGGLRPVLASGTIVTAFLVGTVGTWLLLALLGASGYDRSTYAALAVVGLAVTVGWAVRTVAEARREPTPTSAVP